MARTGTLEQSFEMMTKMAKRLAAVEADLADLKVARQSTRVDARRAAAALNRAATPLERSTADLAEIATALAEHHPVTSDEAEVLARHQELVASGQATDPPPAVDGKVVWSLPRDIHKADEFMGWVFPFPTGTGHILCSTDTAEPFGVRMEVQLADGRRYAVSYTEKERRS